METPEATNPTTISALAQEKPVPVEATPIIVPEKPHLWLTWKIRLRAGAEKLATSNGREKLNLFECPDQVRRFLKSCDDLFDTRIVRPIISALRTKYLENPGGLETVVDPDVILKMIYDIKIEATDGPLHETKGELKITLRLDQRSIRGQIGLVEYLWRKAINNPVKAHFRQLATHWTERLAPSESTDAILKSLQQEIRELSRPDMVPQDELPPAIADIKVMAG